MPEYLQAAVASSQWDDSSLTPGLRAGEVPSQVAKAVSERRFTTEFAKLLADFAELEQPAYQEAEDEVARRVKTHYRGWEHVKREQATEAEACAHNSVRKATVHELLH